MTFGMDKTLYELLFGTAYRQAIGTTQIFQLIQLETFQGNHPLQKFVLLHLFGIRSRMKKLPHVHNKKEHTRMRMFVTPPFYPPFPLDLLSILPFLCLYIHIHAAPSRLLYPPNGFSTNRT